jgi:TolA-binding protein
MSERDVVQEAARALREAHGGAKLGAGFTRGRIMQTLHERRRRRISLRVTLGPLLAVLVAGTAWAQVTGQLPELWQQAVEFLVPVNAPTTTLLAVPQPAAVSSSTRGAHGGAASESGSSSQEAEPAPLAEEISEASTAELGVVEPVPPVEAAVSQRAPRPHVSRSATASSTAASSAPTTSASTTSTVPTLPAEDAPTSAELAKDPELALFREGHELHFRGGSPAQAIAAYLRYLERYPQGRFVPEARYNMAIDWLKQGEHQRAKVLLAAFARGDYGGYRQEEARKLLATLP